MKKRKKYNPIRLDGSSVMDFIFLAILAIIMVAGLWISVKAINGERAA